MSRPDVRFHSAHESLSDSAFQGMLERYRPLIQGHQRVLVGGDAPTHLNALIALCRQHRKAIFVAHSHFDRAWMEAAASRYGADVALHLSATDAPTVFQGPGGAPLEGVGVFTSGTTGEPKLAMHAWDAITRPARSAKGKLAGRRWLMAYSPTSFAGLQVLFAVLESDGALYYPGPDRQDVCRTLAEHRVEVVSATPTFFKTLIAAWPRDLPAPKLVQVTLGGEVVTQRVIDLIDAHFKPDHITHIYASTEAGSAIVVSDRRAGFPAQWLDDPTRRVQLRLRDGILQLRSPAGMEGYYGQPLQLDEGWFTTPDRAERVGDRVHILGRADCVINVGGVKVAPEQVEAAVSAIPGVIDAHVYQRTNPITGTMVVVDAVTQPDAGLTVKQLRKLIRAHLPDLQEPGLVRIVERLTVSNIGKKSRRQ